MAIGRLRPLLVAILSLIVLVPTSAAAQGLAPIDRETIRTTISSQIEAFRRDDAAGAYSHAAPGIKRLFPSAERFMDMVRSHYQPVYRPQSVTFGEVVATPNGILQKVFLTGPDGENWIAEYLAERQPDGSWRISGCRLTVDPSPLT